MRRGCVRSTTNAFPIIIIRQLAGEKKFNSYNKMIITLVITINLREGNDGESLLNDLGAN